MSDETPDEANTALAGRTCKPSSVNLSKIPPSAERSCSAKLHCASKLINTEQRCGTLKLKVVRSPRPATGIHPVTESVVLPPNS